MTAREIRAVVTRAADMAQRIANADAAPLPPVECPSCGTVAEMGAHVPCPQEQAPGGTR